MAGTSNQYADELGALFAAIPKTVLAAIAVSFASQGGDRLDEARVKIMEEWRYLYENGIVPQKPAQGVVRGQTSSIK